MIITKKGKHIPKKEWAAWRDQAVDQIARQLPIVIVRIDEPTNIRLEYWAGDRKRRDMPAIIDSIFHCLEKAGVVQDDTFLWISESSRGYDKDNPRAVITFL